MRETGYYSTLFNSYSKESRDHFIEFWNPIIINSSKELSNKVFTERKCLGYHTCMGYFAKVLAGVFEKKISTETTCKISDTWLCIKIIDEMIDKNQIKDVGSYLDDVVTLLTKHPIEKKYFGIIAESLDIIRELTKYQDYTRSKQSLLNLKTAVIEEHEAKTFEQYLDATIKVGEYSGLITYDMITTLEGKIFPENAEQLFRTYSASGNLADNILDFRKDQNELGLKFTCTDYMKLLKQYRESISTLLRYPQINLIDYIRAASVPVMHLTPVLIRDSPKKI
ncbi:MAG: hypothetical protein ACP5OA_07540 [Candidatus Woesearchaeota archaeon]